MRKSQPVTVIKNDTPLFKQRAELTDQLRLLGYDFVREPTMDLADRMRAIRDEISDIERRVVRTQTLRALMDLVNEGTSVSDNLDDMESELS